MTTEEKKKLYATGEWVVAYKELQWNRILDPVWFNLTTGEYQLIHKKHADVLDHVLNGGKVKGIDSAGGEFETKDFFEEYDETDTYEIIKDKPDLNDIGFGLL